MKNYSNKIEQRSTLFSLHRLSGQQELVLLLDVSTLYTLQGPELHLDVSTLQGLCCTWTCLLHKGLSCTRTCLNNRSLYCSQTCLHQSGLNVSKQQELCCPWGMSCTWTYLGAAVRFAPGLVYTTEACVLTGRVNTRGLELHLDVSPLITNPLTASQRIT